MRAFMVSAYPFYLWEKIIYSGLPEIVLKLSVKCFLSFLIPFEFPVKGSQNREFQAKEANMEKLVFAVFA